MTTFPVQSSRRTTQLPLPAQRPPPPDDHYDLYPAFPLPQGSIQRGYDALASALTGARQVMLDGFAGVAWEEVRMHLDAAFRRVGRVPTWQDAESALKPEAEVNAFTTPFLGSNDPLFGTRATVTLLEFFQEGALAALQPDLSADLSVIYGCGAALTAWPEATLVYLDLPKNELQFRARAGQPTNLGVAPDSPKAAYKRSYFVDWPVLGAHKAALLPRIDLMVDAQRTDDPTFTSGKLLRGGLEAASLTVFRVRPWFEPGPWGGQWIKARVPELPQDVPNYAWSFELIVPENGLLFESDGLLLEVSFDGCVALTALG